MSILIIFLASLLLLPPTSRGQSDADGDSLPAPEINFGDYFYAKFPGDTLDQLYECLCDMQIIKCSFTYKLQETTSFGFPYYYTVTDLQQIRTASNVSSLYKHAFVCDVLRHFPQDDMNCYRQTVSDDRCDRSINCLVYSVQLNSTKCSSRCSLMIWIADYTLDLEYYNFADRPKPVKDGTCPAPEIPTSTVATINSITNRWSTNVSELNDTSTGSISDATTTSGGVVNSISTIEESKSSITLLYIGAGVGAFLLIVAITTHSGCRYRKRKLKYSSAASPVTSSSEISASNSSRSLPDDHMSGDDLEAAGYQTLGEVIDGTGDAEQAPECDADGYNIIRECVAGHDRWVNTNTRSCRPLPVPPESDGSISRMPSLAVTSEFSTPLPASLQPETVRPLETDHSLPNNQSLPQPHDRPKPTPHKRQAESNQIDHMGIVNLRSSHPALSGHTQVRLVRTPWGDMELITLESDLPVFTEYYSRLQLLNMKDNGLGVVGVSAGQADNDSHKYLDFLEIREAFSKQSLHSTQQEQTDSASYTKSSLSSHLYIFYFGSVELTESATVSPCDYLTVLDIDPEKVHTANSGYLTVLDVGCSSSSNGSQLSVKL